MRIKERERKNHMGPGISQANCASSFHTRRQASSGSFFVSCFVVEMLANTGRHAHKGQSK